MIRNRMRRIVVNRSRLLAAAMLAFGVGLAGCPGYLAPAPRIALTAPLDTEFTLRKDQTAWIHGEELRVTFDEMKGDSRCPRNTQCVQAGEAKLEIRLHKSRKQPKMFTLSTVEPRVARYREYEVELAGLEPLPDAGAESPPEYHVLLVVRKP